MVTRSGKYIYNATTTDWMPTSLWKLVTFWISCVQVNNLHKSLWLSHWTITRFFICCTVRFYRSLVRSAENTLLCLHLDCSPPIGLVLNFWLAIGKTSQYRNVFTIASTFLPVTPLPVPLNQQHALRQPSLTIQTSM